MDRGSGFDTVASYYDSLAQWVFRSSIVRSQAVFLDKVPANAYILVLGGGSGCWLEAFLQSHPGCKILYIESSTEMIKLARKRVRDDPRINFLLGTEDSINSSNLFDAVFTFYLLDLFSKESLSLVIKKIKESLKPNALWLVADFVEKKWWHSAMLVVMYKFFRLTVNLRNQRLPDWAGELSNNEIKELNMEMFYGDFIKSALYTAKK